MALNPGFQQAATATVRAGFPGDLASAKTAINIAAEGLFALGDLIVGNGAFYAPGGNQVVTDSANGTTAFAGIVLRNAGLAPMSWADSQIGYGFIVPDGTQATVANGGDFKAIITGVNASGVADHVPLVGENIWVNLTTGAWAAAPISATSVTGYTRAGTFKVTRVGLLTSATVGVNQTFGVISGNV